MLEKYCTTHVAYMCDMMRSEIGEQVSADIGQCVCFSVPVWVLTFDRDEF